MRIALNFLALFLLPLLYAVIRATWTALCGVRITDVILSFIAGFGAWLLIYAFARPPARFYVFGHELTHAIWGLLTGSKVSRLKVNDSGGSVMLSNPGVFSTLAPYFVPFYTVLVIIARLVAGIWIEFGGIRSMVWIALLGVTWGFHVTYTIRSLLIHQPDIREYGRLFSFVLIFLINFLILGAAIVYVANGSFADYFREIYISCNFAFRRSYALILRAIRGIASAISNFSR